jgi:hypothetical protein
VGEGLSIVGVGPGVDVGGSFELVDESRRQGVWWNKINIIGERLQTLPDEEEMIDRSS